MTDYFTYNTGSDIPSDAFRISPSQLSRFFDQTSQWYREMLLGEAPEFTGSTASELGTCLHAAAAMYFDTGSVDMSAIDSYIASLPADIDHALISDQYRPMVNVLINDFLSKNKGTHSETFFKYELLPGIFVAGTVDMIDTRRRILYDYKSMGSLDSARVPTSFPRAYYFQQLAYVYLLRQNGIQIDYCKLVYISRNNVGRISGKTQKPLQDYPSTVNIVTHQVTDEDMLLIENCLKLVAESVLVFKSTPEIQHLLAQDYRLRQKPKPILFKD